MEAFQGRSLPCPFLTDLSEHSYRNCDFHQPQFGHRPLAVLSLKTIRPLSKEKERPRRSSDDLDILVVRWTRWTVNKPPTSPPANFAAAHYLSRVFRRGRVKYERLITGISATFRAWKRTGCGICRMSCIVGSVGHHLHARRIIRCSLPATLEKCFTLIAFVKTVLCEVHMHGQLVKQKGLK